MAARAPDLAQHTLAAVQVQVGNRQYSQEMLLRHLWHFSAFRAYSCETPSVHRSDGHTLACKIGGVFP